MISSTEIIKKANKHKERIGEDKATYIEGVLCGYFMAAEEIGYKDAVIEELNKKIRVLSRVAYTAKVGKKQAGHLLDGVEYREMPEVKNEK